MSLEKRIKKLEPRVLTYPLVRDFINCCISLEARFKAAFCISFRALGLFTKDDISYKARPTRIPCISGDRLLRKSSGGGTGTSPPPGRIYRPPPPPIMPSKIRTDTAYLSLTSLKGDPGIGVKRKELTSGLKPLKLE